MKSNECRHFSGSAISKMTTDRVAYHLAQLLDCLGLRGDGVSHGSGNISTVCFVFLNFENDFAHKSKLFACLVYARRLQ